MNNEPELINEPELFLEIMFKKKYYYGEQYFSRIKYQEYSNLIHHYVATDYFHVTCNI